MNSSSSSADGSITVKAPGKLLLCGEYAVVSGAPALCAAVNRHATCRVSPGDYLSLTALGEGPLRVTWGPAGIVWSPTPQIPARFALVEKVLLEVAPKGGMTVELDSTQLNQTVLEGGPAVKLGLGSSAAAAVALVAALDVAQHGAAVAGVGAQRRWFEQAQRAHLQAQGGLGSGVDVAASAMGGMFVYVRPSADPKEARMETVRHEKLGVRMLAVWTGEAASTVDLLGRVGAFRQLQPQRAEKRFGEMTALAQEAARAAINADRRGLLMALHAYGGQMQVLGEDAGVDIVGAKHRRVRELAEQHQCVAKPSGAGGGDVAVCFAPSGWEADALRKTLVAQGFPVLDLSVEHEGASCVKS